MAKYGDILVGLLVLIYTIVAVVLEAQGIADLGQYLAQPELSGPFALAALGRGWNAIKKAKKQSDDEAPDSDGADE